MLSNRSHLTWNFEVLTIKSQALVRLVSQSQKMETQKVRRVKIKCHEKSYQKKEKKRKKTRENKGVRTEF